MRYNFNDFLIFEFSQKMHTFFHILTITDLLLRL